MKMPLSSYWCWLTFDPAPMRCQRDILVCWHLVSLFSYWAMSYPAIMSGVTSSRKVCTKLMPDLWQAIFHHIITSPSLPLSALFCYMNEGNVDPWHNVVCRLQLYICTNMMPGDPCFWLRQFFFDKTVSVFPLTYIMLNWSQEQLFLLPWYLKCAGQSEIN